MAKAYWIATYRKINDPDALAAYAKLGVQRYGRLAGATWFEARPPKLWRQDWAYAQSLLRSTASRAPFRPTKSPKYQAARKLLGDTVVRDIRIVEGAG